MNSKIRNPKSEIRKKVISRIIDANINRAVEGLRVMEEVARFVVEDKRATEQLKKLRVKLRNLAKKATAIAQRKALKDIGRRSYTRSEKKRRSIRDVLTANAKRVQEALRVLEEFTKLVKPGLGRSFKTIRFKTYDLEKRLLTRLDRTLPA